MYSQEEIAGIYQRQYKMVYQICQRGRRQKTSTILLKPPLTNLDWKECLHIKKFLNRDGTNFLPQRTKGDKYV